MMQEFAESMRRFFGRMSFWSLFENVSDKSVTTMESLSLPAIWNGVSRITGHTSQLPMSVYESIEKDGERIGGKKDRSHNAHWLMNRRPNAYQTPIVYREQMSLHSLLEGNGRSVLCRRGNRIMEQIPVQPHCTVTGIVGGVKYHLTHVSPDSPIVPYFDGSSGGENRIDSNGYLLLKDSEVFHIPGLSHDGVNGLALNHIARRNLGAAIATEKRIQSQMEKGFAGSLMLQAPIGAFRDEVKAREFLEHFEERHNSPEKAGKVGLLREGITANLLAMNNRDAEMVENRKFARQDQALLLGLEQILGDDSSVSYNSLEQKSLAYLMNCLNRWLKRWEEEAEYKLLSRKDFESEKYYIRFNTAALLKSDFKTTMETLALGVNSTLLNPNEARAKIDYNPREGGEIYANPAITPGEPAKADASKTDTKAEPPRKESGSRAAQNHIAHLIGVEANRVKQGAKAKNFLTWMDNFYAKKFESNFADNLEAIGVDRNEASVHCAESRRLLLEVAEQSQQEELAANVAKCVANWKSRASLIGELANV